LTSARVYLGTAWSYAGDFREIQRHTGGWIEEARARDDRYAVAAIAGMGGGSLRHAMDEQPELGLAELEAAMAPWPNEPFATTHYGAFSTTNYILGSEPGPRLLKYVDQRQDIMDKALMQMPSLRFSYLSARLRGILLAIDGAGSARSELLARARSDLRALERLPGRTPRVFALAYAGSLLYVEGDREGALRCMRESAELALTIDHFCAAGVRYLLALLEGGEQGRRVRAEIRGQVEAEGWKSWQRGLAMRVPGNLALLGG
jgi:hypothetical protein